MVIIRSVLGPFLGLFLSPFFSPLLVCFRSFLGPFRSVLGPFVGNTHIESIPLYWSGAGRVRGVCLGVICRSIFIICNIGPFLGPF